MAPPTVPPAASPAAKKQKRSEFVVDVKSPSLFGHLFGFKLSSVSSDFGGGTMWVKGRKPVLVEFSGTTIGFPLSESEFGAPRFGVSSSSTDVIKRLSAIDDYVRLLVKKQCTVPDGARFFPKVTESGVAYFNMKGATPDIAFPSGGMPREVLDSDTEGTLTLEFRGIWRNDGADGGPFGYGPVWRVHDFCTDAAAADDEAPAAAVP